MSSLLSHSVVVSALFQLLLAEELSIATYNTYDIIFAPNRAERREAMMNGAIVDGLPDTDVLCMQEAFSSNGIEDWLTSPMSDEWPYEEHYVEEFHSTLPCPSWMMEEFTDPNGLMYECTRECASDRLWPNAVRGVVSWILCVYTECIAETLGRDTAFSPIPNQALYDFGMQFQRSECLGCLWHAPYIFPPYSSNPTNISLEALYDLCTQDYPSLNFRSGAGLILWSKLPLTNVRIVPYPGWIYIPRMVIIATVEVDGVEIDIACTHLEPQNDYLGNFVAFDYGLVNAGVHSFLELTSNEIDTLENAALLYNSNPNVIILGDFNTGPDADPDLYNQLVEAGVKDVYSGDENRPFTRSALNPLASANETIDHILYSGNMRVLSKYIGMNEPVDGQYMSDHYAVRAVFEIGVTDSPTKAPTVADSDDSVSSDDSGNSAIMENERRQSMGLQKKDQSVSFKMDFGMTLFGWILGVICVIIGMIVCVVFVHLNARKHYGFVRNDIGTECD